METNEFADVLRVPCRYLRSKEMFCEAPEDDSFASGLHWCGRTQESFGPDGAPADAESCHRGRGCYLR
jgi:hypothetical protein